MILPPQPPPNRPKMASSSAKTAPRPPQDEFEALLFASSFPSSIWVRSGSNLGSISHPLGRPKRRPNRTKKRPKIMLPRDGLQDRSKTVPDPPQGAPRPPQTPPDSLLGAPQDPIQDPYRCPKRLPKGNKNHIIILFCVNNDDYEPDYDDRHDGSEDGDNDRAYEDDVSTHGEHKVAVS